MSNIYDDVADLQTRVAALESRTEDSGWHTLPLASGITAYSADQTPCYRRIGSQVFLTGVFKGVEESNFVIATLPEGYRPAKKVILPFASIGQKINRMEVLPDGIIRYSRSTIEPTTAVNWHSIACSFSIAI